MPSTENPEGSQPGGGGTKTDKELRPGKRPKKVVAQGSSITPGGSGPAQGGGPKPDKGI